METLVVPIAFGNYALQENPESVHRVHAMCRSTNMELNFSHVDVGEQSYLLRSVLTKENTSFGFRLPDSACE